MHIPRNNILMLNNVCNNTQHARYIWSPYAGYISGVL